MRKACFRPCCRTSPTTFERNPLSMSVCNVPWLPADGSISLKIITWSQSSRISGIARVRGQQHQYQRSPTSENTNILLVCILVVHLYNLILVINFMIIIYCLSIFKRAGKVRILLLVVQQINTNVNLELTYLLLFPIISSLQDVISKTYLHWHQFITNKL